MANPDLQAAERRKQLEKEVSQLVNTEAQVEKDKAAIETGIERCDSVNPFALPAGPLLMPLFAPRLFLGRRC